MKIIATTLLVFLSAILSAQEKENDSVVPVQLQEIIIIGKKTALHQKQHKSLTTVEDYLQQATRVNMIKRGAYGWEPLINNMGTERTVVTIDGMRIFGACTDKMDPVTSYVEISNLSDASIVSGQQGSCHGATIGGSVDLKRTDLKQQKMGWNGNLTSGYESNNKHKILGSSVGYNDSLYYVDVNAMFRQAENYHAGNRKEISYSQFTKYNLAATAGYFLDKQHLIEGSVIYDRATDVGYPALPMDVSLAEATIASLRYSYSPVSAFVSNWETKLYFNTIVHIMDDTKRPSVPIHMDMPGMSDTYGFYSKLTGVYKKHHLLFNLNAYYNKSLGEMTMYPENPDENLMFMYTWPDVRTFNQNIYLEDKIQLTNVTYLKLTASMGFHSNTVASETGLQSLQIFYPDMNDTKNRLLKSISVNYNQSIDKINYSIGLGYGERAPTVSEGYGFYLYNSHDSYDYIGNPGLKNEKSLEGNVSVGLKSGRFTSKVGASIFYIKDYIIGSVNENILPMTIGAKGVKIHKGIDDAVIFNTDLNLEYKINEQWHWNTLLVYSSGRESYGNNLPFMSPLRYSGNIEFQKNKLLLGAGCSGNLAQDKFAAVYGETKTADYVVFNIHGGYFIYVNNNRLNLQTGVENVFDTYYTTFSDWNGIPRMGRNFFLNLTYAF